MSTLGATGRAECEEGFYNCSGGYCIPSFLLGNGERDCPRGEDEATPAARLACPGYYRCHGSGACVHPDHVCDGVHHCPHKDDERYCSLACPPKCYCEGLAFKCDAMIKPRENLQLRYLDLSLAQNVTLDQIHYLEFLFLLNLSSCVYLTLTSTTPEVNT